MAEVPPLVGLPLAEAQERLRAEGLESGPVREIPDAAPVGEVLKQSIDAGQTVLTGTVIDLTVSSGEAAVETGGETRPEPDEPDPDETEPDEPPVNDTQPEPQPLEPPEPQLTSLDVEIHLPEGEGTILVTVKVDGATYLEHVADRENGSVSFSIEGTGTKQMDIYFDGVLHETQTLHFGA